MQWFSIGDTKPDTRTDAEILAASRIAPWQFAALVARYEAAFLRKATSIIRDPEDAKEIVQDTFTKIYVHGASFTPHEGATFSSWAYRILVNTSYTYYQKRIKQGARFVALDPEFEQWVADKESSTGKTEVNDGVERILARLPQHFSFVLRLHYLERWSQQDIADTTGESVGTIKTRIHRAKAAFKQESRGNEAESLL